MSRGALRDDDDWEKPVRKTPADLVLHLEAFDGPIDFLLDLALRQKIDLGRISVIELADRFQEAVALLADEASIERRADWLIMASRLILLRARLMFPASEAAEVEAQGEAADEVGRLLELGRMRAAAQWLSDRPQLGIDVFARPAAKALAREGGYVALMEACLFVLEVQPAAQMETAAIYVPMVRNYWTVKDAITRIQVMLAEQPEGMDILAFVPYSVPNDPDFRLRTRTAIAGTLVAGLELAKAGEILLHQESSVAEITIRSIP